MLNIVSSHSWYLLLLRLDQAVLSLLGLVCLLRSFTLGGKEGLDLLHQADMAHASRRLRYAQGFGDGPVVNLI